MILYDAHVCLLTVLQNQKLYSNKNNCLFKEQLSGRFIDICGGRKRGESNSVLSLAIPILFIFFF